MAESPARLAEALWRAVTYVSVAQLHLRENPLLAEPLLPGHVKERPSGHWGTVPGTALVVSHLALAHAPGTELVPVIGAGHAGVVQLAMAWLFGDLAVARERFSPDTAGLARLVAAFPEVDGLGSEVTPLLPGGWYLGGQLGTGLSFAQGASLDAPGRVAVPLLGDGECETPATAAGWLAGQALRGRAATLPIVHLNGFRMGGQSLLAKLNDDQLEAWAAGCGYRLQIVRVDAGSVAEHEQFHQALADALGSVRAGQPTMLVLRCVKGWSGPVMVDGRAVLGTWQMHKTPLTCPRKDPRQLAVLRQWLASYRADSLFAADGTPVGLLAKAVETVRRRPGFARKVPDPAPGLAPAPVATGDQRRYSGFAEAVTTVVRRHAGTGNLLLVSPDELASNRLGCLADEPWAHEVLAEEVLLGWLAGWTGSGRRGLLISYEAFAPLLITGLGQLLKQRRLLPAQRQLPSMNVLLTSYGWHNTFTHGDPSAITALLAGQDSAVRVTTPADAHRLATALDEALSSTGRCNIIVAGKHTNGTYPPDTLVQEQRRGLAVWRHVSDEGEPDLVLVAAGDLAAAAVCAAIPFIRARLQCRIRVVAVHDLTVLGPDTVWPLGLSPSEAREYFGDGAPMVVVTLGHPAAIWGLLQDRFHRPTEVIGWAEPPGPMPQERLAQSAGLTSDGVRAAALRVYARRRVATAGKPMVAAGSPSVGEVSS